MYYFISYMLFYVLDTQFCEKQLLIADFTIVAMDSLFSPSIVTSYSSIVLAHAN